MKNRVLITSVGRKISLIRAFKEAGWHVIGTDSDPTAVALQFCDEVLGVEECEHHLVIPTRDAELLQYAGLPFSASRETIETCLDKFKFYKWCKANGFKTPEVYFVKPRISQSGKKTECVWQELVEGEEYSIDVFSNFLGHVISIVPRQRIKVVNGESSVTQVVALTPFLKETENLCVKLGLVGHSVLQGFVKESTICWTDINCRFGGASVVAIQAGCKSPEWLLKIINGEEVKPCIGQYQVGVIGKSFTEWEIAV